MHMYRPEKQFGHPIDEPLDTAIAIVGMSCRFAGARTPGEYWANLRAGVESVRTFSQAELHTAGVTSSETANPNYVPAGAPIDDMEWFDAELFGTSPRDAAIMDPQHRHFLECAWEALEDAGHDPERFPGAIGVFAGSGHNAYFARNLLSNPSLIRNVGQFLLRHTGNDKDFMTTRASYLFDLRGPSINIQTACSTSLVAVHTAVQHLLNEECDMAIAGGVSIELPHGHGYMFEDGGILSPDGHCRPFDAQSRGTVFGSGVGLVVLRRLADALASGDHIHALIRGTAVNNDGAGKVGYLAPSIDGQANVIAEALDVAEVPARTIGYVEAHGTGTPVGDPIEIAALTQAFRRDTDEIGFCALGSVKGNIGHTDTAAGTASLIKVALALQNRELPPSINYASNNPACSLEDSPFRVNAVLRPWPQIGTTPRRAGISSLGVGGTNAHAIVEEAPARPPSGAGRTHHLMAISAATARALEGNRAALGAAFAQDPTLNRADAAYTLAVGRRALAKRSVFVVDDIENVEAALMQPGRVFTNDQVADRAVHFMFCGAGSQYTGMGAKLYQSEPVFRAVIDQCIAASDADLARWLFPSETDVERATHEMQRPSIALPCLFAVQVALARLWQSWGISPAGMIGHSSGEYAAAHIAGVISLEDALRIVGVRGRLFERMPEGGMLSVPMSEDELRPLLPPDLAIAAVNGAALCVASGTVAAIASLEEDLAAKGIETRRVAIAVAAHSPMLDPLLDEFRQCLTTVRLRTPTVPFVSNLTGTWITDEEAQDPDYWVRHLRQTVRFTDGLQNLLSNAVDVLLEVGPGRTMASLARQHPARARSQPVLTSLRHPDDVIDDTAHILESVGRLWALGVPVDQSGFWSGQHRQRIPLPTYNFDHVRHWIEPGLSTAVDDVDPDAPLPREADVADWFYEPVWHQTPTPNNASHEGDALVFLDDQGIGAAIARQIRAAGQRVIEVRAGRHYRERDDTFVLNPARREDYGRLIDTLSARDRLPLHIYHCWLVTGAGVGERRNTMAASAVLQDKGFNSLLALAQSLAAADGGNVIRIAMVSDHMQRVSAEHSLSPAKATILGAASVVTREYPHLDVRSIDVTGSADLAANNILAEMAGERAEAVCYRVGERWIRSFDRVRRPANDHGLLQERGVYLITGGLGGIGLTIARYLAETCSARLALLVRTPLPPRSIWAQLVADADTETPEAERIRAVQAIEAAGGEVLVVAADVSDSRAVGIAIAKARAKFGRINGVFHTAGILDDGLIQLKVSENAQAVLAPKLLGTLALDAALADAPPDFMILFSSISAFAGLAGQVDYAAANSFLDAFAQAHLAKTGTRVISVGWSKWQEVGMAAALAAGSLPAMQHSQPLNHPILRRIGICSDEERVATARLSPERDWLIDEHRLNDGSALIPGTGYLELVRAAYASFGTSAMELNDIVFLAPFVVPDGTERDLRIHLRRDAETWQFAIVGRDRHSAASAWANHVSGSVRSLEAPLPDAIDLPKIRQRCPDLLPTGQLEASPFMRFGVRWGNVKSCALGRDEALLHLELPAQFNADLDEVLLHPALLDFATAGGQALLAPAGPRFLAPASYGQVRIWSPLPARIFSHIRYRAEDNSGSDVAVFDVTVTDECGTVLVDIQAFTMMAVRDVTLLSASAHIPPAVSDGSGVSTRDGLMALDRILAGAHRPHLIVSPQPLSAAVARLHPAPRAPIVRTADGADGAPRTAAETMIARLWGEMLGLDDIRFDDNFFDLGGHSLLAVQFINRLRKKTGITVSLSALLERPTVDRFAFLVDPEGAASVANDKPPGAVADAAASLSQLHSGVVTLRAGSAAPPLFIVHDGLGETLLYRNLALAMPKGQPIYGLGPQVRSDGSFAHTSITEMAAAYIERVRHVHPDGPYLLAGLCAGGVIAFEMAQQLRNAGAIVPFVGILDAADVGATPRRFYVMRARLASLRQALGTSGKGVGAIPLMVSKAFNAARWEVTSRFERSRRARTVADMAHGEIPGTADGLTFLQLYEVAHRAHRPQDLFDGGDVTLFRATVGNGNEDDIPFTEKYSDRLLGWGQRVDGDVMLVEVPGGHTSLLQPPHVDTLAVVVQRQIDRALENWSTANGSESSPAEDDQRSQNVLAELDA